VESSHLAEGETDAKKEAFTFRNRFEYMSKGRREAGQNSSPEGGRFGEIQTSLKGKPQVPRERDRKIKLTGTDVQRLKNGLVYGETDRIV